jgi:hypothetical protein
MAAFPKGTKVSAITQRGRKVTGIVKAMRKGARGDFVEIENEKDLTVVCVRPSTIKTR